MKIGTWIKSMFAAKTHEPPEQTIDQFVDELVAIQKQAAHKPGKTWWVEWRCPDCELSWLCLGYSREFTPVFCTYCGKKFDPPDESELAKANFRDERKAERE